MMSDPSAGSGLFELLDSLQTKPDELGVVIVDHGSRRAESNRLLLRVADSFRVASGLKIVEPAHMELAEPSIQTAFDRAVEQGASLVVVHPYFLSPGRHWHQDIPRLVAEAAGRHANTRYVVTAPLGLHPLMLQIIQDRIVQCLTRSALDTEPCDVCRDADGCQLLTGDAD
jgi:sirohydrochlorin ferrochelatase